MIIRFTVRAQRRAEGVDRWWRKHRPEAPEAFKQELQTAQEQLLTNPHSGNIHCRERVGAADGIVDVMNALKAHVVNGRIIVDEPVDLPDGTELEVYLDRADDDMDEEERAELSRSIDEGLAAVDAGEVVDFDEVLASLRAPHP